MSSRERILARVRKALTDVPGEEVPQDVSVARDYLHVHGDRDEAQTVALLAGNLTEYRATVHRTNRAELACLVGRLLAQRGSRSVVVPPGLPPEWLPESGPGHVRRVEDRPTSTAQELDAVDSVLTGCAVAIAETGTLVLDAGPDQGRRRITLVPDHHICVVHVPGQVVGSVAQALALLDPRRPLTWISGPSATSDIELDRVEGVHGPRTLEVILVDAPADTPA